MKKLLNDPFDYVDEMLAGLCAAHPEYYRQCGDSGRVITRANNAAPNKVGIVSDGGSGHLPIFAGYVGTINGLMEMSGEYHGFPAFLEGVLAKNPVH